MIYTGIVEDSRTFRNSLVEKLKGSGQAEITISATNGNEFLEAMKSIPPGKRPSSVLMDIEMPGMNGIETVTIAKELYPETEFIMLTSFDDDDKIFEAIKAGASGYLLKEEKLERIIEALVSADEGAPMSPRIARKALSMLKNPLVNSGKKEGNDNYNLTDREMAILELLVDGFNYQHIATKLFISPLTVKKHIRNIYTKLQVNSKLSAVKIAMKKGWFRK